MNKIIFNQDFWFNCCFDLSILKNGKEQDLKKFFGDKRIVENPYKNKIEIRKKSFSLSPKKSYCRATFGNRIAESLREINSNFLITTKNEYSVAPLLKTSDLKNYSKISNIHGFKNKTESFYNTGVIGFSSPDEKHRPLFFSRVNELTQLFDYIVGNTCVILDRDKESKNRRKEIGKAGSYLVSGVSETYNFDYYVLSNFWPRHYELTSLVLGLVRICVLIAEQNQNLEPIFNLVKKEDIIKAINNNDTKLALKNFNKISKFLIKILEHGFYSCDYYPIHKKTIKKFNYFISQPYTKFFKGDFFKKWINLFDGHNKGFEYFLIYLNTKKLTFL